MSVKIKTRENKNRQKIPVQIKKNMSEWLGNIISQFPEYNITETVSEWAERCRKIGEGLTANPGPFEFYITPYLREIVDNLSDSSPIQETYVIKATQVGFTVGVMENHMGYCIEYGIGPMLYVGGDQTMAEEQMEKRVDEMILNAGLSGKIRANIQKRKGKSTGDRSDSKSYGGTFMRAIGPNSESKAATFPSRILQLDEMDKYPIHLKSSGIMTLDIVKKLIRRQDSYEETKKTIGGSTPKDSTTSRIEAHVESGDKRLYNIRCPKCKHQQPLLWKNLRWDKTEDGNLDIQWEIINDTPSLKKDPTYFECENEKCKHRMKDTDKIDLLQEKGYSPNGTAEWISTKKSVSPLIRSYIIPAWYGFRSWMNIALEWEEVKDDPFKLPDFINDVMGETWKESDQKPSEHVLLQLAQEYEQWPTGHIDRKVLLLTLTVDIQKDRIEAGLMGWGRNKQGYMIDYWTFEGNPSEVEDKCWKDLSEKISAKYLREDGQELYVMLAFIDSQYLSDTVDLFCDGFPYREGTIAGVFPVQARETQDKLVKEFKSNIKTPVIGMHDQKLKRALYNVLKKRPQGPGHFPGYYLHFSHEYGPEFYKQLTSENIIPIKVKNVIKGYKILNDKQRRNEVLDICKMNMAALQYSMDRFFDIYNKSQKLQKRPEIQENSEMFFNAIENMFYE